MAPSAESTNPRPGWTGGILLAVIALMLPPLLFWMANERMLVARGPSWGAVNFDPSYAYLMNSLRIAEGASPGHTDHPGTPLQLFGAACLHAFHPEASAQERADAVLDDPDAYHRSIVRSVAALVVVSWLTMGLIFWWGTGSLPVALACQSMPLGFAQTYYALGTLTPELLFFALGGWLGCLVAFVTMGGARRNRWGFAVLGGLFLSTAIMTKLNWLPLAAVVMLFPATWRERIRVLLVAVACGLAWAFLIRSQLPYTIWWVASVAVHSEKYGRGSIGFPACSVFFKNVMHLGLGETMHLLLGLMSLPLLFAWRASVRAAREIPTRYSHLLVLLLLGCVGVVLLAAKHPAEHYVLPIAAGSSSVAFAALAGLRAVEQAERWRWSRFVPILLLLAVACSGPFLFEATKAEVGGKLRSLKLGVAGANAQPIGLRRLEYYRADSPAYALYFGNSYAHNGYSSLLQKRYPAAAFLNVFSGQIEGFGTRIDPRAYFSDPTPVLVVGSIDLSDRPIGRTVPLPPDWRMSVLQELPDHHVYLLEPGVGVDRR